MCILFFVYGMYKFLLNRVFFSIIVVVNNFVVVEVVVVVDFVAGRGLRLLAFFYFSRAVFVLIAITHSSPHDLSTVHCKQTKNKNANK